MQIDGRKIANEIKEQLQREVSLKTRPPKLGIIYVGENKTINQFLKIKKSFGEAIGVEVEIYRYPAEIAEEDLLSQIKKISDSNDGLIVQLPLPESLPVDKVLAALPPGQDVDALARESFFESPVVLAVQEIFGREDIDLRNKEIVVVGQGRLVGAPLIRWLLREGLRPIVLNKSDQDFSKLAKADIIISGVGRPGLIKKEMLKDGVVLIDAGTSELHGKTAGDIDPGAYAKAKIYTPVPGGLGPITVAKLYENLLKTF